MAQAKDITSPPMTDATAMKILLALKGLVMYPNVDLTVVDGKVNLSFVVADYDPTATYEVGEFCIVQETVEGVLTDVIKQCIADTTGTYDPTCWENY